MAKKRTGAPWMPAAEYGRGLRGLTVNLLVADVTASCAFAETVLGAATVYRDPDIAVLRIADTELMLHADHTYDNHPLRHLLPAGSPRGSGAEFRVHGVDPDAAVARATAAGYRVLAEPLDKGHGLREAYILDSDGYCWVPDVPTA